MKEIEKVVSDNVQKLLDEYELTHQELADIAGVSVSSVGKWVLKKAFPRMGAIQRISDHFGIPKTYLLEEGYTELPKVSQDYNFIPTAISAGLPIHVDGVTSEDIEKISIPDNLMGNQAGNKDISFTKIYGDSMNRVMPDGSLIAVKPISSLDDLKSGDIVVYARNGEYAVKRLDKREDKLIFKPDSTDPDFYDDVVRIDEGPQVKIKGKVVLYIVNLD